MRKNTELEVLSASAYFDAILENYVNSCETVYYLLKRRLSKALKNVYSLYGFGLNDDFEDTIDDFYLYLYDGSSGGISRPFSMLNSIQNKNAFFGWVVATYRNFLLNKSKEEMRRRDLLEHVRSGNYEEKNELSDETMIQYLATAIAYADQQFTPRNLFIFYRMLLSLLDHKRAIPQEEMAQAMKMHPSTYRVCTKRQKDRLQEFILLQETRHSLDLDVSHTLMRDRIVACFNQLYELLLESYKQALERLPSATEIQALRHFFSHENGSMMHEENCYGYRDFIDVKLLYESLKSYSTS